MSDPEAPRPRLVSVNGERADEAGESPAEPAPESSAGTTSRRLVWGLAVLAVAAIAGLVVQTLRANELRAANDALAGELFATRSALDAYVTRFEAVRESVEGLQSQLDRLGELVSEDPLAPGTPPAAGDAD